MHSDLLEGFYILSVSSFELLSYWDTREEGRGQLERAALHPDRPPTGLNDLDNVTGDAARDEIIEPLDSPYKPADDIRAGRVNIRLRQYVIRLKSDTRHQTSLRHGLHHSFELRSQSAPAQGALKIKARLGRPRLVSFCAPSAARLRARGLLIVEGVS